MDWRIWQSLNYGLSLVCECGWREDVWPGHHLVNKPIPPRATVDQAVADLPCPKCNDYTLTGTIIHTRGNTPS